MSKSVKIWLSSVTVLFALMILYSLSAEGAHLKIRVLSTLAILGMSSGFLLSLVGFVIYKAEQSNDQNNRASQITDWLTKLLMGAGLSQSSDIYRAFISFSGQFAKESSVTGSSQVIICVIIGCGALGILFPFVYQNSNTETQQT